MVEWVTHSVGDSLGPLLKLLPVAYIAGAESLGHTVGTHSTPFVVVASEPNLSKVAEAMVACYVLGVEVAMVVDYRHLRCVVVVQPLGCGRLQQEI